MEGRFTKKGIQAISNPQDHTMEGRFIDYIYPKVHDLIKENSDKPVFVHGDYDRKQIVSDQEKNDKRFNWQRPTASIEKGSIVIHCFPGIDYVQHYASIVASYKRLNNQSADNVWYEIVTKKMTEASLLKTNIYKVPRAEVIILGMVEQIGAVIGSSVWTGGGPFKWTRANFENAEVFLLGCEFSYWGDIAGSLVQILAKQGIKTIVYCGKLGGLKDVHVPNNLLVSGNFSCVEGRNIRWRSLFSDISGVVQGKHVTEPSVIFETKQWLKENQNFDFVDPEIGHMAKEAKCAGVDFSYLHIVSDVLSISHEEDLSNERKSTILEKRNELYNRIGDILIQTLNKK